MRYLKVKENSNLIRDPNTNSIINTNMNDYQQYLTRNNLKSEENKKIHTLEEDVANMKDDLNEIKFLLRSLIDGSK